MYLDITLVKSNKPKLGILGIFIFSRLFQLFTKIT